MIRPRRFRSRRPQRPHFRLRSPWDWDGRVPSGARHSCNICGWFGDTFDGPAHCEAATCPVCGSIARDRYLLFCMTRRMPPARYRVLETSPRMGPRYRAAMARWFDYRASDFDQRTHRADLKIDLQSIDLPNHDVDVLLSPHVLEHVPQTGRALREIHRVLRPGGRLFLQVPVLQGLTSLPEAPEFHGDSTPVFWRFGLDLTERLRSYGFQVRILTTLGFYMLIRNDVREWPDPTSPEFDVRSILTRAHSENFEPVADSEIARLLGFVPGYMFLTWECGTTEAPAGPGR